MSGNTRYECVGNKGKLSCKEIKPIVTVSKPHSSPNTSLLFALFYLAIFYGMLLVVFWIVVLLVGWFDPPILGAIDYSLIHWYHWFDPRYSALIYQNNSTWWWELNAILAIPFALLYGVVDNLKKWIKGW